MIYAVIDTNVIVSALITHNASAATVLVVKHLFDGSIIPVYNDEILAEYDEVLHRPKFNLTDGNIPAPRFHIHAFRLQLINAIDNECRGISYCFTTPFPKIDL